MRKLTGFIVLVLVASVVLTAATNSITKKKKSWKGMITYSISYDGEDVTPASVANAPKEVKIKIMGDKSSQEMVLGMATVTMVENPEFDLSMQMIEFGDKKYAIKKKLSEEKADTTEKYDVTIDFVNETKMIATYKCKKAVVTFTPKDTADGEEQIFNYFYSEELGNEDTYKDEIFEGIPGLLLEYSIIQGNVIMIFNATEVKKGGVSDADFLVPVDYKVVTEEELEKELSQ